MALVRDGHERAFEVLVQRHRRALARYCRRFTLADARAEDVLQQAFLSAWIAIRAGAEVRDFKPWLFRIVHNAALNSLRAERSQGQAVSIDATQAASVEPTTLPGFAGRAGVEDVLLARDLLASMADLPEMQREVLLRSALRGDSYEQVAGALGISDGAVRGLLHRARATLRAGVPGFVPAPLAVWAARGLRRAASASAPVSEIASGSGSLAARGSVAALAAGIAIAGTAFTPVGQHAHHDSRVPPVATAGTGEVRSPLDFAPFAVGDKHAALAAKPTHSTRAAAAERTVASRRARSSADAVADAHTGAGADGSTGVPSKSTLPAGGEGISPSGEAGKNGSSTQQAPSDASAKPSAGSEASTGGAQSTTGEASAAAQPGQEAVSTPARKTSASTTPTPLAAAEVTTSSGALDAKVAVPVATVEASVTPSTGTVSVAVTPIGTPEGSEAPVAASVGSAGISVKVGPVKLAVGSSSSTSRSSTSSGGLIGSLLGGL